MNEHADLKVVIDAGGNEIARGKIIDERYDKDRNPGGLAMLNIDGEWYSVGISLSSGVSSVRIRFRQMCPSYGD